MAACQSSVADGFFQSGDSSDDNVPEDFPVIVFSDSKWSVAAEISAANNSGCDRFVAQQERLKTQVASGVGYALDENGNLQTFAGGTAFSAGRAAADLTYGVWTAKASSGYVVNGRYGATSDRSYLNRVDGYRLDSRSNSPRAISPHTETWAIPENTSPQGHFSNEGWHGRETVVSFVSYVMVATDGRQSRYLSKTKSEALCRSGFHPRGEDSSDRIAGGTGRSLTGLSHANGQIADRFWCRSDLRYLRSFQAEHHTSLGQNVIRHADAVAAGSVFTAYGRLNCYYTSTAITTLGNGGYRCVYMFPLPQCTDNGTKREFTKTELDGYTTGAAFTAADDGTTDCAAGTPADPPQQAGFTADACVTASLEMYENRIVGSDAEPGVPASDRTLVVAAGRTAWDLDVTSPHPLTASAPRDATAGSGDPDGCADGSESRADHASSPADAARKQSPAPSYAASDRTNTAAPPNDADGDIDYSGAVKNMAHRYASRVAENICAAKRAEASLRLALLEAEEKLYKDWMGRYEAWAKGKKDAFGNWRPTGYPSGTNPNTSSSLSVHPTFYSFKHAKRSKSRLDYADAMSTMYETRETAAGAAAGRTLTKPTVASSWCGDPARFVKSYSDSVTRLKTAADNATTAGTAQAQPSKGPTSAATPDAGSIGVVDASKLSEGAARVPAEWGTSYTYAYTDSKGKRKSGSSGCWEAGTSPTFGAPAVTYTPGAACIYKAAVPEVLASGTASSVTYASYTFTLSGGGWTRTITVPAATRAAVCSSWQTSSCYASPSTHPLHSGYVSLWNGSLPSVTGFPSTTGAPGKSVSSPALSKLLGKYYPSHADRANLKHTAAQTRNQAATNLGKLGKTTAATITLTAFSNLAVPVSNPASDTEETTQRRAVKTAAETYQNRYTQAYDNAYDQAVDDMGGTTTTVTRNRQTKTVEVWSDFDWRYHSPSLAWGSYQEDPATTYSASTATPRDGTGCDLVSVASDGTVSVEATRLDYETSSYGKGSVYSARTDAQRTCKIRRTRTPELILEYQPSRPSGTDASKAVSFFYVDYQPTAAAERFKLYDEAEVFAVKTSLADSPPVFCGTTLPADGYLSHTAGQMASVPAAIAKDSWRSAAQLTTTILRPTSNPPAITEDHCFARPRLTAGQ